MQVVVCVNGLGFPARCSLILTYPEAYGKERLQSRQDTGFGVVCKSNIRDKIDISK